MAAKVHATYAYGNGADAAVDKYKRDGGAWYDKYVSYCKAEGLIVNEFDDLLAKPVTKAQMVFAWSKVLPEKEMAARNEVLFLPDVGDETPYHNEIITFYRAGITTGTDTTGMFKPNSNITRAEAAAMLMNLIEQGQRSAGKEYLQTSKL